MDAMDVCSCPTLIYLSGCNLSVKLSASLQNPDLIEITKNFAHLHHSRSYRKLQTIQHNTHAHPCFKHYSFSGQMSFWANVFLGKCLSAQMSFWANVFLGKCLLGKCLSGQMSFWANVSLGKCLSGQMSFWANVFGQMSFWANVFLGKCLSGQMSSGQMSFWANVFLGKCLLGKCPSRRNISMTPTHTYLSIYRILYEAAEGDDAASGLAKGAVKVADFAQ
jgi:hypothetical protein